MSNENKQDIPAFRQKNGFLKVKKHVLEKYQLGQKLPSETDLAKELNMSRYATFRALTELVAEGFLERKRGSGTIVIGDSRSNKPAQTNNIAFIADEFQSYLTAELLRGIEQYYRSSGFVISLLNSNYSPELESKHLKSLSENAYSGAIVRAGDRKESFDSINELVPDDFPLILVDRNTDFINFPSVQTDHLNAAYDAVKYLIALGHERIAMITYDEDSPLWMGLRNLDYNCKQSDGGNRDEEKSHRSWLGPIKDRTEGYKKALTESGLDIKQNYIQGISLWGLTRKPPAQFLHSFAYECMDKLLALPQPPTAVFCAECLLPAGAYRAIENHGLKVPDDISIISVDDGPEAQSLLVPLTTMAQPLQQIGQTAANLLQKVILNESIEKENKLNAQLIIRNSTAKPKQ